MSYIQHCRSDGMAHYIRGCLMPLRVEIMVEYSSLKAQHVIGVNFKGCTIWRDVDAEWWVICKSFFKNTVKLCESIKTEIYKINEQVLFKA